MKNKYTEYIYSLNKYFINYDLIHNNDLSMFFLTDISNKRTEIYDTYQSICHLKIISKIVAKHNINKIVLDCVSQSFYLSIKSIA